MEISLIRHGKSTQTETSWITCSEFTNWVNKYDENGVFEEDSYPLETLQSVTKANSVVTSDLRRAVHSASLLNPDMNVVADSIFREIELPSPSARFLGIKLHPNVWSVVLRLLWLCGYSKKCESFRQAKQRARKATENLTTLAQEHSSVVLVGHGFFNLFIALELQRHGWKGKRKTSLKHWIATTYSRSQ